MICIPITGPDLEAAIKDIHLAKEKADLLELRLDLIKDFDLEKLVELTGKSVIVTYRPIREGGAYGDDEELRLEVLRQAATLGVDFIDVEWDSAEKVSVSSPTRLIVSRHFFDEFPKNYEEVYEEIASSSADIVKIAVKVDSVEKNARIFRQLKNQTKPSILIGMGEAGLISRIANRVFRGLLTFACLEDGKESAPGQISSEELINRFRYYKTNGNTKLYGVIGNPVAHSMSPDIHNAGFDRIQFNGLYLPLKVEDHLAFLETIGQYFSGFSVTIPHKESFFSSVKEVDALVKRIGAFNTLTREGADWKAANTDLEAAMNSILDSVDGSLQDKTVLVLGAGGAAKALILGAKDLGARVYVTNRTQEKGLEVARNLGVEFLPMAEIQAMKDLPHQVILNTTSVGMSPNVEDTPLPNCRFRKDQLVFDAIYNPNITRMLREAKEQGAAIITGRQMFVGQGALQFERWTGEEAPRDLFATILDQKLS